MNMQIELPSNMCLNYFGNCVCERDRIWCDIARDLSSRKWNFKASLKLCNVLFCAKIM